MQLLIDGDRLSGIVAEQAAASRAPVSHLRVDCRPGDIRLTGKAHKFLTVPFEISVRRIDPIGPTTLRVELDRASVFGIPLPNLLVSMVESKLPSLVRWDAATDALIVELDRILPPFVSVQIAEVVAVDGGIVVILGPGGANPPEGAIGRHDGRAEQRT